MATSAIKRVTASGRTRYIYPRPEAWVSAQRVAPKSCWACRGAGGHTEHWAGESEARFVSCSVCGGPKT